MVQWLRACTALQGTWVQFPGPMFSDWTACIHSFRRPEISGVHGHPQWLTLKWTHRHTLNVYYYISNKNRFEFILRRFLFCFWDAIQTQQISNWLWSSCPSLLSAGITGGYTTRAAVLHEPTEKHRGDSMSSHGAVKVASAAVNVNRVWQSFKFRGYSTKNLKCLSNICKTYGIL